MKKQALFSIGIFLILASFQLNTIANAEVINLVADEWCPYNCSPDSDAPGFIVEVAQYAFERAGYSVNYTLVPWSRAIEGTRNGLYDGIIGAGQSETPDFIFPENESAVANHTFFVTKGSSWSYKGIKSLDQVCLGVISNYSYGDFYDSYIKSHENDGKRIQVAYGETGLKSNIEKLLIGRIDVLIEDSAVFQYYLYETNSSYDFLNAGIASTEKVYVAFSPKNQNANKYAEILSHAIQELRETGKLAEILAKYGVHD